MYIYVYDCTLLVGLLLNCYWIVDRRYSPTTETKQIFRFAADEGNDLNAEHGHGRYRDGIEVHILLKCTEQQATNT